MSLASVVGQDSVEVHILEAGREVAGVVQADRHLCHLRRMVHTWECTFLVVPVL